MNTRMRRVVLLMFALLCFGSAGWAGAQSSSGALNGLVVDQSGGAVPGVTVTAVNPATGEARSATTNTSGAYQLPALPVGTYTLTYTLEGFKTTTRTGVLVEAAVPRSVNITLEVGGLSEVVKVEGSSPILNVSTPTVTRRLGGDEITAVPSSTRNFTHLLTATAGVSADLVPVGSNDTGAISPSVKMRRMNRSPYRSIVAAMRGMSVASMPSPMMVDTRS